MAEFYWLLMPSNADCTRTSDWINDWMSNPKLSNPIKADCHLKSLRTQWFLNSTNIYD